MADGDLTEILERSGSHWIGLTSALILVIALTSCETLGLKDSNKDRLNHEMQAWERAGIHNYEYVVQVGCFCPPEVTGINVVTVRGDSIVSVRPDTVRVPPIKNRSYSVDGLFAVIREAIDEHEDHIDVSYDATFHYPTHISFYRNNALDSGMSIEAKSFQTFPEFAVR